LPYRNYTPTALKTSFIGRVATWQPCHTLHRDRQRFDVDSGSIVISTHQQPAAIQAAISMEKAYAENTRKQQASPRRQS
jgi:hypothetical protein